MKLLLSAVWVAFAGIVWAEVRVIRKARTLDSTSVALREREIAAACRATGLSIGGILGLNRMWGLGFPDRLTRPLLTIALGLNAVPAIRFLWIYYRREFR